MRRAVLALLLLAAPAQAQPACVPGREGVTACLDGRLCLCRFERGGQLTGRPDGFRWDCGALRPDCRPPEGATVSPWPMPSLLLDVPPNHSPRGRGVPILPP